MKKAISLIVLIILFLCTSCNSEKSIDELSIEKQQAVLAVRQYQKTYKKDYLRYDLWCISGKIIWTDMEYKAVVFNTDKSPNDIGLDNPDVLVFYNNQIYTLEQCHTYYDELFGNINNDENSKYDPKEVERTNEIMKNAPEEAVVLSDVLYHLAIYSFESDLSDLPIIEYQNIEDYI